MGNAFQKTHKILVLGLRDSGKTTFIWRLQLGEVVTTFTNKALPIETITNDKIQFICFDIAGNNHSDEIFSIYYEYDYIINNVSALIWFIDSIDRKTIDERYYSQSNSFFSHRIRNIKIIEKLHFIIFIVR